MQNDWNNNWNNKVHATLKQTEFNILLFFLLKLRHLITANLLHEDFG